ncbi:MAG: histidinol-phosphate transaminase [Dokdonella sp.]
MSFDALTLASTSIVRLRAYDTGPDKRIARECEHAPAELGSNEHAFGPSPKALAAMQMELARAHRYPDPDGTALRKTLANHFAIDPSSITFGNGSNELIVMLAECFAGPEHSVVYSQYAFAVYAIATAAVGATAIEVPSLARDHVTMPLGHDLDAMSSAIRSDTKLVFLANPNNPTGSCFDDDALDAFLDSIPQRVMVVIDEAYIDFVSPDVVRSAIDRIERYPNLVILRTFSKAHALAALRIGFAISHVSTAAVMARLRQPFNVNRIALAAAQAAFLDFDYLESCIGMTVAERDHLAEALAELGYSTLPSQTNFLMVDFGGEASAVEAALYQAGIIVRPMAGYGLPQMLRISIGTRQESERILSVLAPARQLNP